MNFINIINKNNRMSFKDELTNKVIETRERIKSKAINYFTEWLKSAMISVAEEGRNTGCIGLFDDCDGNEYVNQIYYELLKILIIEKTHKYSEEKVKMYIWLLEEVQKTDIFKDITIEIENDILNFSWYL